MPTILQQPTRLNRCFGQSATHIRCWSGAQFAAASAETLRSCLSSYRLCAMLPNRAGFGTTKANWVLTRDLERFGDVSDLTSTLAVPQGKKSIFLLMVTYLPVCLHLSSYGRRIRREIAAARHKNIVTEFCRCPSINGELQPRPKSDIIQPRQPTTIALARERARLACPALLLELFRRGVSE